MSYNDPASDCTLITVSRFVKPCHTIFSTILLRLTRHRKRDPVMNSSDTRIFSLDIFILTMSFLLCYHRGTMTGKSLSPPCPYSLRNASLTFKAGWAHSRRAVHNIFYYLQDRMKTREDAVFLTEDDLTRNMSSTFILHRRGRANWRFESWFEADLERIHSAKWINASSMVEEELAPNNYF